MANHANKKPPNVECFNEPVLTAKKISQHPLAYGKLYLRKAINRYFWHKARKIIQDRYGILSR
ncbi:hypothetical protein DQY66_04945 [Salmonella enterica subsp. enterica serovar Utah]|nr:hypothetical protein [Salmonella enterica subsp. enterica serovar Utah]